MYINIDMLLQTECGIILVLDGALDEQVILVYLASRTQADSIAERHESI